MKRPTKKTRKQSAHTDEPPLCERLWMVYNPDGGPPRMTHASKRSATDEAKRLAKANPGRYFFVLQAVAAWRAPEPEPISLRIIEPVTKDENEDDEIPF